MAKRSHRHVCVHRAMPPSGLAPTRWPAPRDGPRKPDPDRSLCSRSQTIAINGEESPESWRVA
jgi:hypothetical protein